MSELRFTFLNWRPDVEDTEHDGLTIANNVIHETEGFKPAHLASAGTFATTGGLGASVATVRSLIAKPVGVGLDLLCAWISSDTLHVGLNGVTAASVTTGYPLSFGTSGASQEIVAFDVTEYAGKICFVAEAQQTQAFPTSTVALRFAGYMDY